MYPKVMRVLDSKHNCKSMEQLNILIKLNVNKWITMKTMRKFGKYFQWLNSKFKNWQFYHRDVGLATTNSPLESYNGRIKDDFTYRTYFNLVPALKKFEKMVEFESLNDTAFVNEPIVSVSDLNKRSCKHLVACAYFADKPIMNVPLNIKFNIRYRQRKLVRKSYSNSEEDQSSPSTTSPVSIPVPSTTSPVSVPVPSTTSPVLVTVPSTTSPVSATLRVEVNRPMTRSQVNIVKGSNLIQTNSKVVKNRIKSNYATLNQPDQPKKRGRPAKPTAALNYD
jgi:hypothetical protein